MANQNQLAKPILPELSPEHQIFISQLVDTVNSLLGYSGVVKLSNHLDLSGFQIKNIGAPTDPTDAISHVIAEKSYSAAVLAPQLESNGTQPLRTVRRINDPNQREAVSSFLNDLMSTPPNANAIIPLTSPVMGGIQVVIPASPFTFADGFQVMLESRTDTLTLPTSFPIASISCVGNLVTVDTSPNATGLTAGQSMTIHGVSPASFNGSFPVTSATPPYTLTYQLDLGTVSGSGGDVELNNCYYYTIAKRKSVVALIGPTNGDTSQNRLQACLDGTQIVAVVVLTNSGAQVSSSGGGGSAISGPVCAGAFF